MRQAGSQDAQGWSGVGAALGVALLAAALRALVWTRTAAIHNDGPIFLGLAQLLAEGEWRAALAHAFHPLYPACTAAAHALLAGLGLAEGPGGWERAGALVSIASGAAAVFAAFWLLRWTVGRELALAGSAILAVHPYAVAYSSDVQSDGLYLALFLGSTACGWRALRDGDPRFAAGAGAGSALAYLTRPEGIGVAAVVGLLLGVRAVRGPRSRRSVAAAASLAAVALALCAPYLLHLRESSGSWALTRKKSVLELSGAAPVRAWIAIDGPAELLREQPFLETVMHGPRRAELLAAPASAPIGPSPWARHAKALRSLAQGWVSGLRPELFLLALLGAGWRGRRAPELPFFAALGLLYGAALYGMAYGAGYVNRRHVLPVALLSLGFASAALPPLGAALGRVLSRWIAAAPGWTRQRRGAALVGAALLALIALPKTLEPRRGDGLAERRAAEWLARQPGETGPVAAAKQRVAYYADASFVPLLAPDPSSAHAEVLPTLAYLQSAGARFLVVDDRWLDGALAGDLAAGRGLRRLYRAEAGESGASVYAVEAGPGS